MKKLIMAAAVVCATVSVNASQCMWGFLSDEIQGAAGAKCVDGDGYMEGGTALLYLGTIGVSDGAFTGLGSATLLATSPQLASYKYGSGGAKVELAKLAADTAGQAYTLVLVDANDVTSLDDYEGFVLIQNGSSTQGVNPMDDSDHWAVMQTNKAFKPSDWQTVAVPEPTSGLLLLLGVAGMALRRRRA